MSTEPKVIGTRLQGKVAIVTGGGSGFGEVISKRFAEEGCKVIVADMEYVLHHRVYLFHMVNLLLLPLASKGCFRLVTFL